MKRSFFATLALLAATIVNAQPKTVAPVKESNSLLWKITGKGLEKPSYLFGTMHILCADDIHISENFRQVINGSDLIYFEVDMDNMMELLSSLRYLKMSDNKKLSDLLPPEDYEKVKAYFTKNAAIIPFAMMESFKPFFISSLISDQTMDCPSKEGMEGAIMKQAKTLNKEIKGLETIQFQASVFDSIPYERQAKELVKAIESPAGEVDNTKELVTVYKEQNLDKIQAMTAQEDGLMSEYLDLLLYKRNADWAVKMAGLMPDRSILFAVGAAHLPGQKGVIELLKQKGYTVTPVDNR